MKNASQKSPPPFKSNRKLIHMLARVEVDIERCTRSYWALPLAIQKRGILYIIEGGLAPAKGI